jgi:hypothetical protein
MQAQNIAVITGNNLAYLQEVIARALENDQSVSLCVDGGLKVKRGESMWSPPLGHTLAVLTGAPRT